ncbi:hypothetical protein VKI21_02085 [Cyanobacterium aponinum UTEX 3222]|uniref:hypothetical protein n=1 Tax=Cyanobacterium aponinum TaxID=379064 RepID=UPI0030883660|nr:hypothetical protein VKI21_02085 [Cyanobacterium aponinum UTEX 3222]
MTNKKEKLATEVINNIEAKFKDFTQWSTKTLKKLWDCGLSQSEWKVYSFLSIIDPFGDRWVDLPETIVISNYLNISQSSFYRAIAKLSKNGIICFEDKGLHFKNNITLKTEDSSSNLGTNPQTWGAILKTEDSSSNLGINPQTCENQPLKPLQDKTFNSSQTIQTIKTISYSSDSETSLKERENIDLSFKEDCGLEDKVNTESSKTTNLNTQVISQDNSVNNPVSTQATQHNTFSAERSAIENTQSHKKGLVAMSDVIQQSPNTPPNPSKVQIKAWEWLPDGEWKVDHKLDPIFHDWLAKKWMVQYQKSDFFQAKADVLAYFQKTPERLEIRWLQYQEELNARNKHRQQIGITDPTPTNRQSLPSGNQNTVVISDGQRTIKSKDYTGISKQEQIPFNPNLRRRFTEWLNQKTGKTQPQYNNNQTQGLSHI